MYNKLFNLSVNNVVSYYFLKPQPTFQNMFILCKKYMLLVKVVHLAAKSWIKMQSDLCVLIIRY